MKQEMGNRGGRNHRSGGLVESKNLEPLRYLIDLKDWKQNGPASIPFKYKIQPSPEEHSPDSTAWRMPGN